MEILKSDLQQAILAEENLKEKVDGLGEEEIEKATETNLEGVADGAEMYEKSAGLLQEYRLQLQEDLQRIRNMGITFFEVDHSHEGIATMLDAWGNGGKNE